MTTAADRRQALANAHAAWIATSKNPAIDAVHNLKQVLVQQGFADSTNILEDVTMDGTTICIRIDFDEGFEVLEIDAYGNTMQGSV